MDQNDPGSVLSPTTIHESTDSINEDPDTEQHQDLAFIQHDQEEDDEYVTTLFAREKGYQFDSPAGLVESDKAWMESARLESVEWVMQSRVRLGLGYRTAYLSIMYFDRFLSLQWTILQRKDWKMRLLALTCLSLAAKMEEVKLLKLSAFGGGNAAFTYRTKWIKRMEHRVLNALQWKMRFISPFSLVQFYLRNLFQLPHLPSEQAAVPRAALIIFQAATATSTMEFKPSVMAMAATLLVMDESLTKAAVEAKIGKSTVSNYGFASTAEQVHSCYEMLKKVVIDDRALLLAAKSPSSSGSS